MSLIKNIKKRDYLIKNHYFDIIYKEYGNTVYKNLLEERICYDIYLETNNKFLMKMMKIKMEILKKTKYLIFLLISSILISMIYPIYFSYRTWKNKIKYSSYSLEYDNMVNNYSDDINKLKNVNDLDIIMKVINDMQKGVKKISPSEEDEIFASPGLTLYIRKKGVCRHFADDFVYKINTINNEYNARVLYVLMQDSISESTDFENFFGNHALVIMNIPNSNVKLVVDPLNELLGILSNGKIHMFDNSNRSYEIKWISNYLYNGTRPIDILGSFNDNNIEELENEYGIYEQDKSYEKILKLEK